MSEESTLSEDSTKPDEESDKPRYAGNFVRAMQTVAQLSLVFIFAVRFALLKLVTFPFKMGAYYLFYIFGTFAQLLFPPKLASESILESKQTKIAFNLSPQTIARQKSE